MKWDVPCPHEAEYEALRPVVCQHCAEAEIERLVEAMSDELGAARAYLGTDAEHGVLDCVLDIHGAASRSGAWDCARTPLWRFVVDQIDAATYARRVR